MSAVRAVQPADVLLLDIRRYHQSIRRLDDSLLGDGTLLGQGSSVLIFPEGRRRETGQIDTFQPGVGMLASRMHAPVVPVRIDGVDRVLPEGARWARPGPVRVAFGDPVRFDGNDYAAIAHRIEEAVRAL